MTVGKSEIRSEDDSAGGSHRYALTLLIALGCTMLFFRSVLPRIARFTLGGRLRIKRVGLLGLRGLEWRSKGFNKTRLSSQSRDDKTAAATAAEEEEKDGNEAVDGLCLQVSRIYPIVRFRKNETASPPGEAASASKTWITIRIEGVGVTLPKPVKGADEMKKEKEDEDQAALLKAQEAQRREQDAENARLEYLMQSRPSSPQLGSTSSNPSGSVSSMPAFATAMAQTPTTTAPLASQSPSPNSASSSSSSMPSDIAHYLRNVALPMLWLIVLNSLRTILYLIISALPFLTSIIDVQMTNLEVYSLEAEAVIRVERVSLDLDMSLIPSQDQAVKASTASGVTNMTNCWSETLYSMPNRIGSGAKGAASFVTDGLPAGRVSLRLSTNGLQVIEAATARRHHSLNLHSGSTTTAPTKLQPSGLLARQSSNTRSIHKDSQPSSISSSSAGPSTRLSQRSKSFDGQSSLVLHEHGASEWADWADEGLDSKFPPSTSWLRGSTREKGESIPPLARVLSMPGTNSIQLGLILSGSSSISSKESIHIGIDLCPTTLGADALFNVLQTLEARKAIRSGPAPSEAGECGTRSQLSKHFKQQKPQAQAKFLEKLGSASLKWPAITLMMSSKTPLSVLAPQDELPEHEQSLVPSSVQMLAEVKGFTFAIQTSNPADELHQKWLGTCGVKDHRRRRNTNAFADRFRWNQSRLKEHVEHRRAFHLEAKLDSINVKVGTDGEAKKTQSELLNVGNIEMRARSTWTPFGLLSSSKESAVSAQKFFLGDPNEQAVILEVSLGKLVGDLQSRHATGLLSFAQIHRVQRKARRKELGLQKEVPSRPAGYLESLPKFSMGVRLMDISYRLNASNIPSFSAESPVQKHDLSLVLAVPNINVVFHASYVDQYIKRSEQERKAAWKSLSNDQLEWSLQADTKNSTSEEGYSIPRAAGGDYKAWQEEGDKAEESETTDDTDADKRPAETMTILEAIKRMKELQAMEAFNGQTSRGRAFTAVNKWKKVAQKKAEMHASIPFNTRYCFESQCTVGSVEVFWVMKEDETSTRRKTFDAKRPTTAEVRLPKAHTKLHIVGLSSFEASTAGHLPGFQDIASDAVKLEKGRLEQDVRVSLEDVDVDMWHPSALDATRRLADLFACAKRLPPIYASAPADDEDEDEKEEEEAPPRTDFIDALQAGTSAYISIGSIIAHVGGVDERCDHTMSRGVGFEGKRAVIELACSHSAPKRIRNSYKSELGARSALELSEDLTSSCSALATRHGKAAMAKLSLFEFGLFPILDGEQASNQHLNRTDKKSNPAAPPASQTPISPSIFAPAVWDFHETKPQTSSKKQTHAKHRQQDRSNFIFWMPFSATKVSLVPKNAHPDKIGKQQEELSICTEGTRLLSFKIELLHTYCILMAIASLKSLVPGKRGKPKEERNGQEVQEETKDRVKNEVKGEVNAVRKAKKPSRYNALSHSAVVKVDEIHVSIALPDGVDVFCHIRRLEGTFGGDSIPQFGYEALMAAVQSSKFDTNGGIWEEAVRMRDVRLTIEPKKDNVPVKITVNADGTVIKVPFNYQVHPLIDGTVVSLKATRQLLHQFIKGGTDSIITPVPEEPKHLPIIKLKIRAIAFAGDDDPFETRLNIIWRAGGDENQARSERDAAFREKARQMEHLAGSVRSTNASTLDESIDSDGSNPDETATVESESRRTANEAKVSLEQAREALDAFNGSSWIRRYANARAEQGRREDATLKSIYGRLPINRHLDLPIKLASPPRSAPLFRCTWSDFEMEVGPTSFPESHLRDFLHEQGAGMPKDMEYSLMVPMHLRVTCSEWKITLRDYPLPLFHVPPINFEKQPKTLSAFELEADVCIAEQMSDFTAVRHIPAIVVPASTGRLDAIEYGISIPRMAMPTKMFGSPVIKINSAYPTRMVWGQSMQPAIHDLTRVIEGITSPPHDPSPRIGFWDKLSLILHGRVHFQFPGDGELHIYLKGSRDPYHILEHGAGWVKCWRGDVEIKINFENDQREVFQIMSKEYLLAIPDLKDYIDRAATGTGESNRWHSHRHARQSSDHASLHSGSSQESSYKGYKRRPDFKKVCLKLTNGVRWGAGLILERTCTDDTCMQKTKCKGIPFNRECRFWTRKKHWEVYQRSKDYADTLSEGEFGDSYKGWRSHHLHFSISIYSFKNGPLKENSDKEKALGEMTNNLYFSPLAWEHFWAWCRLFNSALSLPIREGKLFPGSMEQSPKFGRNLATIKYRFDISPMYITHVYIQDAKSDWARGFTTLLGVKARMGVFHFDLHQRQQEMMKYRPELGESRRIFHKPFYEAEIDLGDIDLRTLAAQFVEPERQLFPHEDDDEDDSQQKQFDVIFGDDHNCRIADRDLYWHDLSDFVELDWAPAVDGQAPKIRLMQALTCPRFNYYRRIESQRERKARAHQHADENKEENETAKEDKDNQQGNSSLSRLEKSKFGREGTHSCLVGKAPAIQEVQKELARDRIKFLKEELDKHNGRHTADTASHATSHTHFVDDEEDARSKDLKRKIKMIEEYTKMLDRINGSSVFQGGERNEEKLQDDIGKAAYGYLKSGSTNLKDLQAIFREWEAFDNRYFVHNPSVFYSNATRDVLLKYYISSRKRLGIVHSLSAKAVRYIRDLGKPEDDSGHQTSSKRKNSRLKEADGASMQSSMEDGPELLRGLLRDTMQYIMSDELEDASPAQKDTFDDEEVDPSYGISDEYEVRKSNVCVLLKPQIVLRSLADDKSTVILTAIRTRIHNYSVKDPRVEEDSVNERVMYRNYFSIDGLQAFHPSKHCSYLGRAKERYGFLHVPLETLIDLKYETRDFERIAPRTNAHMHYDKFNRLRLHDTNRPLVADCDSQDLAVDHLRHRMDLIRLRCPRFAVLANSEHFGASYNIVTDLLLYRDPAYREHAKKLDMMMFSYDFTDLDSLASVVQALQVRIRHAKDLHVQYQLHFQHLNEQGRIDFLTLKSEIKDMVEELGLILEAIKISDDQSGSDKEKKSALRVEAQANDIAWNMMGHEEGELLAKLTIKGASFTWLNKADNSAAITLSIMDLNAVNVAPNAVFTEIISKYNKVEDHPMRQKGMLLNAIWSVLAPVGGIAIIDYLEIALHPLQIQLEKKIGRHLEDYLFGSKREREKKDREQREVEEAMQEELNGKTSKGSALKRLTNAMKGRDASKEHKAKEQQDNTARTPQQQQRPGPRRSEQLRKSTSKKSLSAKSSASDMRSSHRSNTALTLEENHSGESDSDETGQQAIVARQAVEMRNRASRNTTFVNAKVFETIFCLSYKGEKQKSITDLYDLVFRSPRLEYRNRTWANGDLANHLKKDILKAAWNQKATLLRGVIHHRRPRRQAVADNIRAIRDVQLNRLGGSLSATSTLSDNANNKIKELEGEARKEGIEDLSGDNGNSNDNGIGGHPAFRLNVESPDTSLDREEGEEGTGAGAAGSLAFPSHGFVDEPHQVDDSNNHAHYSDNEIQRQHQNGDAENRRNSMPGGPKSLGKFIVKTLGSRGKRRSSSTATATRNRRSSSQTPAGDRGERHGDSDEDSDNSHDESSNGEDDDEDDDDEEEEQASHRDANGDHPEFITADNTIEGGASLDSPHSTRSMRSALTSRFASASPSSSSSNAASPATGVLPLEPSRRGSGLLGNLSPSMAKIHAPWMGHRKESGESTPPRSSSPLANSPLLQSNTSSPEQEREKESNLRVI